MLKISNLSKTYETGLVLDGISFVVNDGEKVGLVGANGSGKSTLLKIIMGLEEADNGSVGLDPDDIVGYLPQHLLLDPQVTVRDFILEPYRSVLEAQEEMHKLEKEMGQVEGEELAKVLEIYGQKQNEFETGGGYDFETRLDKVLNGLHLRLDLDRKMLSLSGGQKARVAIGQLLLKNPTIILLDEPTNHLDLPSLIWLESYLRTEARTVVVVSHDRQFLDRVVSKVIEIDQFTHRVTEFGGNYTTYIEEKRRLRDRQVVLYEQQQERFKRLQEDADRTKRQALRVEASTHDDFVRARAKKVAKKAKSKERRIEREISSEETIQKPEERKMRRISLDGSSTQELLVRFSDVYKSFGSHAVIEGFCFDVHGGDRVALIGSNGSGKTTILRMIEGEIVPDSGSIYVYDAADIGYLPQEQHDVIASGKKVLEWFRSQVAMYEDEARTYLGSFGFSQDLLFRPLSKLSQGEISMLLVSVIVSQGHKLILLDEPTNHLDFESIDIIEEALSQYQGALLVVTHDRFLLGRLGFNTILAVENGQAASYPDLASYEAGGKS